MKQSFLYTSDLLLLTCTDTLTFASRRKLLFINYSSFFVLSSIWTSSSSRSGDEDDQIRRKICSTHVDVCPPLGHRRRRRRKCMFVQYCRRRITSDRRLSIYLTISPMKKREREYCIHVRAN